MWEDKDILGNVTERKEANVSVINAHKHVTDRTELRMWDIHSTMFVSLYCSSRIVIVSEESQITLTGHIITNEKW